jgi:hypothetical protein
MALNLTFHLDVLQSNLTRLQAGDLGGDIRKTAALKKPVARLATVTAAIWA